MRGMLGFDAATTSLSVYLKLDYLSLKLTMFGSFHLFSLYMAELERLGKATPFCRLMGLLTYWWWEMLEWYSC